MFGGFGPIVVGIVYAILEATVADFHLGGAEVLLAIVSTYIIAFVQAGASVFNQIEHWPIAKSLALHFISLYAVYSGAYLVNTWIPFEPMVLVIFTAIFLAVYFAVWITVYLIARSTGKRLSARIGK